MTIICRKSIEIGENVLLGWNVSISDGDGHSVYNKANGIKQNEDRQVKVGNKVWVTADCSLLKGSNICDNSVISYRTTVAQQFEDSNVIIGGIYPGQIVRHNIDWEK